MSACDELKVLLGWSLWKIYSLGLRLSYELDSFKDKIRIRNIIAVALLWQFSYFAELLHYLYAIGLWLNTTIKVFLIPIPLTFHFQPSQCTVWFCWPQAFVICMISVPYQDTVSCLFIPYMMGHLSCINLPVNSI